MTLQKLILQTIGLGLVVAFQIGCASHLVSPTLIPPSDSSLPPTVTPSPSSTPTSWPPTPVLGLGSTWTSPKDGMSMVFVPAGDFEMGRDEGWLFQRPAHTVHLDSFWIDQTDVTNAMYALCVQAGECSPPSSASSSTRQSYYGNSEFDDFPAINVSWNDSKDYCLWVGRRQPTEAEWEKAARGTDGRMYPWGNFPWANDLPNDVAIDDLMNFADHAGDTTNVGHYPKGASPYGVLDMAGNVWQWVSDWYSKDYYHASPSSNPMGPDSGEGRVLRGGSWRYDAFFMEFMGASTNRAPAPPDTSLNIVGFRCARSP